MPGFYFNYSVNLCETTLALNCKAQYESKSCESCYSGYFLKTFDGITSCHKNNDINCLFYDESYL